MDSLACNFDPNATDQLSNSCDYESCLGCTDSNAFNYDSSAIIDDGSCQSAASLMLNTWSVVMSVRVNLLVVCYQVKLQ